MTIRHRALHSRFVLPVFSTLLFSTLSIAQGLDYPQTRKDNQVDDYHGVKVADPYRWLEDDNSAETAKWVEAENKVTFGYLEKIPYRAQVKARLEQLYNFPKYTPPFRNGAYGISVGGSDWQEAHVIEIATRKVLTDDLKWIKFTSFGWAGNGFFYSRFDAPEPGHELSSKNEFQKVYYHVLGTPQSADELIYEDKQNPQRFQSVATTNDQRFAILTVSDRGKG